jgi:hypothetical protein
MPRDYRRGSSSSRRSRSRSRSSSRESSSADSWRSRSRASSVDSWATGYESDDTSVWDGSRSSRERSLPTYNIGIRKQDRGRRGAGLAIRTNGSHVTLTEALHQLSLAHRRWYPPPPPPLLLLPPPPRVPRTMCMDELDDMGLLDHTDPWQRAHCADVLQRHRSDVQAAVRELADVDPAREMVELDILVDGKPLRKAHAAAECCRAQLYDCSRTLDEFGRSSQPKHSWVYAAIPAGRESAQFSVRLCNNSALDLAVELVLDGEVQNRFWNVPARSVRTKQGRGTRDFKCYPFQFGLARFKTLSGNLLPADESDDEEDEEEDDDEEDGTIMETIMEEEVVVAVEDHPATAKADATAVTPTAPAAASWAFNRTSLVDFNKGQERGEDGAQQTARQKDTAAVAAMLGKKEWKLFRDSLPGAYVEVRCFHAEWRQQQQQQPSHSSSSGSYGDKSGSAAPPPRPPGPLLATRASQHSIKVASEYGQYETIRRHSRSGDGRRLERCGSGLLPVATARLVYRREADLP